MKKHQPNEILVALVAWMPRVFCIAVGVWTLIASLYVVMDQGWGAVCVAGIGSAIVNGVAAIAAAVFVIVRGVLKKNFRWWALGAAIGAPAASAALIFGVFYLTMFG